MDYLEQYRDRCRKDPRSDEVLFSIVCSRLSDPDDDLYWEAVRVLHGRFNAEIFARCSTWSESPDADLRRAAADVLAQAHIGNPAFEKPAGEVLVKMLSREDCAETLNSLAMALGHNGHPGRVSLLANLRHHPSDSVRFGVACGLKGSDEPAAVETLIELSRDADGDVRNWATFALGSQSELDNRAIREALWARVDDPNLDAQGEAIVGLARRRDSRVITVIERLLQEPEVSDFVVEAAEEFPDPRFLRHLERLKSEG